MQINVDLIYPIGSIYMTTSTVSPAVLFGGTWERIKGRCIVGVDENDTDFNTVSKTGGSKDLQKHKHEINYGTSSSTASYGSGLVYTGVDGHNSAMVHYTGSGDSGNLQPYYTAFIWCRTA